MGHELAWHLSCEWRPPGPKVHDKIIESASEPSKSVNCELSGLCHLKIGQTIFELQQVKATPASQSRKTTMHNNSEALALIGLKLLQSFSTPKITPYTYFDQNRRHEGVRPRAICRGMPHMFYWSFGTYNSMVAFIFGVDRRKRHGHVKLG